MLFGLIYIRFRSLRRSKHKNSKKMKEPKKNKLCGCYKPLSIWQGLSDLWSEVIEFCKTPNKDELSDILFALNRLLGAFIGKEEVELFKATLHNQKIQLRMLDHDCIRSKRNAVKHNISKSEHLARYMFFRETIEEIHPKEFYKELQVEGADIQSYKILHASEVTEVITDGYTFVQISTVWTVGWQGEYDCEAYYFKFKTLTAKERDEIRELFMNH